MAAGDAPFWYLIRNPEKSLHAMALLYYYYYSSYYYCHHYPTR